MIISCSSTIQVQGCQQPSGRLCQEQPRTTSCQVVALIIAYIPSSIFQECHCQGSGEAAGLNLDGGGFPIKHACNWVGQSGGEQQGKRSSPPLPSACQYLHLCSSLPGDEACSYSRFSWQQWQHYLKNSFSAGISVHTWGLRAPRKCRGKCDEAFVEKKAGARTGDWLLMLLLIICQFQWISIYFSPDADLWRLQ